jgi:hypothetical protein
LSTDVIHPSVNYVFDPSAGRALRTSCIMHACISAIILRHTRIRTCMGKKTNENATRENASYESTLASTVRANTHRDCVTCISSRIVYIYTRSSTAPFHYKCRGIF